MKWSSCIRKYQRRWCVCRKNKPFFGFRLQCVQVYTDFLDKLLSAFTHTPLHDHLQLIQNVIFSYVARMIHQIDLYDYCPTWCFSCIPLSCRLCFPASNMILWPHFCSPQTASSMLLQPCNTWSHDLGAHSFVVLNYPQAKKKHKHCKCVILYSTE